MTVVLNITSNPQTFTANTFNLAATTINTAVWRLTVTPTQASTAFTGGNFHAILGQPHGGLWFSDASLELYTTPADQVCFSLPLTWSAGQPITITIDTRSGTRSVTIAGATTGNGTTSYATAGPYIDATVNLEIGQQGGAQFQFAGTVSPIDDTQAAAPSVSSWLSVVPTTRLPRVPSSALMMSMLVAPVAPISPPVAPAMSWQPSYPAHQLRLARLPLNTGGTFRPDATIPNPPVVPLSWAPKFPDGSLRLARAPLNVGGAFKPEATLPNAPAPALSWEPQYPDNQLRLARSSIIVGGSTQPEATIPNALPPFSWQSTFPDVIYRPRRQQPDALAAPPFAGGTRFGIGVSIVRQNILGALTFSTPLTTFGTNLTFTAAAGTTITTGTHSMVLCAGPFKVQSTGTLPGGLSSSTLYYVGVPSSTTLQLALSAAAAKAGTFVTMTDGGTGTHTLVRAVNTAPLYSTFITMFARGNQASSPNQATDSFGNTYTYVSGTPRPYDAFTASAASVAIKFSGVGGLAHTWSASIGNVGGNQDEVVIGGLELFDTPILQSSSIVERSDGSNATITSGTVTTTAKALLVAVIFGNGNVNQGHVFTFLDGFTKIPNVSAEGDVDPAGYIQLAVATKIVDIKGTYSFRAQGTSSEGGQMMLMAFQAANSDLQPFDWLMPQAEIPIAIRRGQPTGIVDPIVIFAPTVVPLSWAPTFNDGTRAQKRVIDVAVTAPLSDSNAGPLTWAPSYPDRVNAKPLRLLSGETAPPSDTNAGPMPWSSVYPNQLSVRAPRAIWGEVAPPSDTNAGPLTWLPNFPDFTRRRFFFNVGGETSQLVIVSAAIDQLAWRSVHPDRLTNRFTELLGGEASPVLAIPNPAAPSLASWLPSFPDRLANRPPRLLGGESAPVTIVVPQVILVASWLPKFPDQVFGRRTLVFGGETSSIEVDVPGLTSWLSVAPEVGQNTRRGTLISGVTQPIAVVQDLPVSSWLASYPPYALQTLRANLGWTAQPTLVIQNPPAPNLSWHPVMPDSSLFLAKAVPSVGIFTQPVLVIPNVGPIQDDDGLTFTVVVLDQLTSTVTKL